MPYVDCKICSSKFYAKPRHLKIGWGKYCSTICQYKAQTTGELKNCEVCLKPVWRTKSQLAHSKTGRVFCSKTCHTVCKNRGLVREKHPKWKGGENIYRKIVAEHKVPEVCSHCGTTDKRVLLVHHVDQNRKNNDIVNLIRLCRNCHYIVHKSKTI
jgi:hypothetical protein